MERLLTAYQEDLLSLEQLRERMPLLRQRERTLRDELNALVEQTRERAAHLRLAETLSAFLTRLRAAAETLDIVERQRIVRLVAKEVLVNDDTIVIRHCIPVPSGPPPTNGGGPNNDTDNAAWGDGSKVATVGESPGPASLKRSVWSVGGFEGPVDSGSKSGNGRGNDEGSLTAKLISMNNLLESDNSRCRSDAAWGLRMSGSAAKTTSAPPDRQNHRQPIEPVSVSTLIRP